MDGEPDVRILADPEAAGTHAAARIAEALTDAVASRGVAHWATTGGSTPVGIYRALTGPGLRDRVPWDRLHVWWGDDRYVPRNHPLSNVLPFDEGVLAGVRVPEGPAAATGPELPFAHVHAMPMSEAIAEGFGPAWVARAYERELRDADLEIDAATGLPVLDVVLMGVGGDGHILSVFPGSPLWDMDDWVAAVPAPTHIEPHVDRVSLHPGIAAAARLPLVVAHGAGKAAILTTLLGPDRDVRRWPAQAVRRAGAGWVLDRAAAAALPR
jgi:6-phosphogluconolactonase